MGGSAKQSSILFLFSVFFVFGIAAFSVYENMHPIMNAIFFSGAISQGIPINLWTFVSHFLLAEIYMKLYETVPGIPWYPIIMFFYIELSLFLILLLFLNQNSKTSIKRKIVPLILVLIFTANLILFFQYTRVAFALGIASTLALLFCKKENKWVRAASFLSFTLCLLTRHEVGVFVFLIQWLAVFFISNRAFSKTALLLNTAIFAIVAGYIIYDRATTDDFLKQFEPELGYQLLDRGNIVPLSSMTNAVDSAKYIAVVNMITDQEYTTIPFLRSLVAENAILGFNQELAIRALEIVAEKLNHSMGLFVVYIGLLILLFRQSFVRDRIIAVKLLLFNAAFWAILLSITYLTMLQFYTLDAMLIMMSAILLFKIDFEAIHSTYITGSISGIFIVIGVILLFQQQLSYSKNLKLTQQSNGKFSDELKKRCHGKILIPGIEQKKTVLFSQHPFQTHDFSAFSHLYLFDSDVTYIEPHYNNYLSDACNCNAKSYTDFMDYLDSKKDSVRIISTQDRIDVIKYYCRVVRNKNYNIVPIDSINVEGNKATVFTFR